MPEYLFNWEAVVLIVTISGFFLRIDWQLKDFKRSNAEFLKGLRELSEQTSKGFAEMLEEARQGAKENTTQHRALMKLMQDQAKESERLIQDRVEDIHSHLRQDWKDHNTAHKSLEEKVSKTLNIYEARK